ncbi:glycosyltransferase [Tenacibaculum finnmarkense genomovar finnmarkense]|uniref:glycosyltransferase n=1 Tax=Tenacibaculum finnmarkense TaxID=2781243 RepID=UPI001E4CAEAD|nr:glycosyltransferase [Tenacibaculum finnmarkense]MCD8418439.1 glycosyltransferase [Tenacibaculum finnmarkense genomovar finnmarkense]MCG8186725.1 glycosyltransferase [Tenacibaculum finnmarkense genomovar finnmarkense]MCG8203249.1 glycosyltransferase [Tenacibaculum finnmarkense genomovar finnmarkense]MCG8210632.1 glycosyltransferase [Tenacibaculum finnmarkense genomovar finnmarkense]MCG8213475.1 glycosyltransferase [Tenacibaculum finnmarkense genomovar finnmarkense]
MLKFSIIVPVYNRPKEIEELLESLTKQDFQENLKDDLKDDLKDAFEVIIIEDGSEKSSEEIVKSYKNRLNIRYFYKENSGAGASRNFGMQRASGTYFIILDSDVILPTQYLSEVKKGLKQQYTDAFGGADAAHSSFTDLQKAINYSMTSVLTTGGIRGKKKGLGKFQPRSFNLGISKKAFIKTAGFSRMKAGEDIDLTFRLWENGFETQLIEKAFVYHKRRSTIKQFFKQTFAFGTARPILNAKYPESAKLTYWFPSVFIIGFLVSLLLLSFGYWQFFILYLCYFTAIFIDAYRQNKSVNIAAKSKLTTLVQFTGYGLGFLKSIFKI